MLFIFGKGIIKLKEQIKKEIIDLVEDEFYIPLKPSELMRFLELDDKESERAFYFALAELEHSGYVSFTKKGKVMLAELGGRLTGTFRGTSRGFGFFTPDENRAGIKGDIFIPSSKTGSAIDGDRVSVQVRSSKKRSDTENPEGEVVDIIERTHKSIMCTYEKRVRTFGARKKKTLPEFYFAYPDSTKLPFRVRISPHDDMGARDGDKVEVRLTQYPDAQNKAKGKIVRIFGNSDSREANYQAILYSHGIRTDFPDAVIAEAKKRESEELTVSGRRDLRDKIIFTIDGADAKDLDDAISLDVFEDKYLLGVHIADVSHYVKEGSALDAEAFLRGTSVYFTDKVVPMLPKELSNGICSLNGGVDRYALSAMVSLDRAGNILGCELVESVINSSVRGVYSEVNDILEKGENSSYNEKYSSVKSTLDNMIELYRVLEKKSAARGALELESSEAKIILDDKGHPIDIVKRERGESERMIEQFMLCANEAVATWLHWQSMPCVYRIHEDPNSEKIQSFSVFVHNLGIDVSPLRKKQLHSSSLQKIMSDAKEKELSSVVSNVMLRSLAKAKYSASNSGHFGLAIDLYCHFTSPIRRYPDLTVHRIVKTILHGKAEGAVLDHLIKFADESAKASSENELRALYAERDIEDLYKVVYMADKVGEEFDAVISSVNSFGMFAELENTCEGLIPIDSLEGYYDYDEKNFRLSRGKKSYRLGQSVRVVIESADISLGKIEMRLVD